MKLHLLSLVAATVLTAVCVRADNYSFKEPFAKAGPFNPNGTVTVENVNGSIEVRAWDKNEVRISGEKSAETAEELKQIELTIEVQPDHALATVKLPKRQGGWFGGGDIRANVQITVMVPASARLEQIRTVNGAVNIAGMQGGIRADSVNGHVKATDVAGNAKLSTVNGGVEARFAAVPAGSRVEASSTNGGVSLMLPANVSAKIDGSTVNGGLQCDFPVEVSGKFVGRTVHGTVGSGDASVKVSTVNGGVKIRKI